MAGDGDENVLCPLCLTLVANRWSCYYIPAMAVEAKLPFSVAVHQGLLAGPDWQKALWTHRVENATTSEDFDVLCALLRTFPSVAPASYPATGIRLEALVEFVRDARGEMARPRLQRGAIPELARIYDGSFNLEHARPALGRMLRVFAASSRSEDWDRVVRAAAAGIGQRDDWNGVFVQFGTDTELGRRRDNYGAAFHHIFRQLSEHLPRGPIELPFLVWANTITREDGIRPHPYDKNVGVERLRQFLEANSPDSEDAAAIAAASLPFLSHPMRIELLLLAQKHASPWVRLEFGWGAALLGWEGALEYLKRLGTDPRYYERARSYLNAVTGEWEPEFLPICGTPAFQAMAGVASYLRVDFKHDATPDYIELLDLREITWPTEGRVLSALVRYHVSEGLNVSGPGVALVYKNARYWDTPRMYEQPDIMQLSPVDMYCAMECDYRRLCPASSPIEDWIAAGRKALLEADPTFGATNPVVPTMVFKG